MRGRVSRPLWSESVTVDGNELSEGVDVMADLEKERWERLLKWLKREHGMNTDVLRIEARDVPGTFVRFRYASCS